MTLVLVKLCVGTGASQFQSSSLDVVCRSDLLPLCVLVLALVLVLLLWQWFSLGFARSWKGGFHWYFVFAGGWNVICSHI
jgi:protein-S-isoprenylcysteine O-methyltransferase Ste14